LQTSSPRCESSEGAFALKILPMMHCFALLSHLPHILMPSRNSDSQQLGSQPHPWVPVQCTWISLIPTLIETKTQTLHVCSQQQGMQLARQKFGYWHHRTQTHLREMLLLMPVQVLICFQPHHPITCDLRATLHQSPPNQKKPRPHQAIMWYQRFERLLYRFRPKVHTATPLLPVGNEPTRGSMAEPSQSQHLRH